MTDAHATRVLYLIVCGAGPAADITRLIELAKDHDWETQVIATPAALEFIDATAIETQTGRPVRSQYRKPDEPRSPRADAIIVAPATYNTINKFAAGISDTYALGILAEAPGLKIPTVVLPFVNSALAGRSAFRCSIEQLRKEGIRVLFGHGEFEPHAPGAGGEHLEHFPWRLALEELGRLCRRAPT